MGPAIDVLVPGRPTVDVVLARLDEWPGLGREIYARDLVVTAGAHFNTAAALARLGLEVAFVAAVGADELGELVLREVEREGLDGRLVETVAGVRTSLSVALNHAGDRGFVTFGPDHARAEERYVDAARELLASTPVRHVHADLSAARGLVGAASAAGATVSVDAHDAGDWLASAAVREVVSAVDLVFVNEREALGMTGAASAADAGAELARRCAHVVLTRGAAGASAHVGGSVVDAPGAAAEPLDATGAGDCFAAGYLWGHLAGLPPAVCLALGNLCGARAVRVLGGYRGAPTLVELLEDARAAGIDLA